LAQWEITYWRNSGRTRPSPWPLDLPQIPGSGLWQSGHITAGDVQGGPAAQDIVTPRRVQMRRQINGVDNAIPSLPRIDARA